MTGWCNKLAVFRLAIRWSGTSGCIILAPWNRGARLVLSPELAPAPAINSQPPPIPPSLARCQTWDRTLSMFFVTFSTLILVEEKFEQSVLKYLLNHTLLLSDMSCLLQVKRDRWTDSKKQVSNFYNHRRENPRSHSLMVLSLLDKCYCFTKL